MGGHGGLNILPQKRWNVYNYENREKVRRDEEQAAREEQLKRDQARKRDAEFRLERLRAAKGLAPLVKPQNEDEEEGDENEKKKKKPRREPEPENSGDPGHINLFEGIKIFDPVPVPEKDGGGEREEGWRKQQKKMMMMKKKEDGVVVGPEDEKYRLGYGVAGKGVKLPWYLQKPSDNGDVDDERGEEGEMKEKKKSGRKTVEELREERLKRERKEKERERVLMQEKRRSDRDAYGSRRFSRR